MRPRWDRRRYSTPSTAATSPTASKARSSEMISIRSPGPGAAEPDPRAHRDAQVAPVPHAGGGRAVDELGAAPREEPRAVGADDAPVAHRDQVHAAVGPVDREVVEHPADVVGPARVLHVHEDGAPSGRQRRRRRGRLHAAGERALGRGGAHRERGRLGLRRLGGGAATRVRVGLLGLVLTGFRDRLGVGRFFFAMADEPSTSARGSGRPKSLRDPLREHPGQDGALDGVHPEAQDGRHGRAPRRGSGSRPGPRRAGPPRRRPGRRPRCRRRAGAGRGCPGTSARRAPPAPSAVSP